MDAITKLKTLRLEPLEQARLIKDALTDEFSQVQLSKAIGQTQPWVAKRLSLLNLNEKLQTALKAGKISASTAYYLSVLPPETQRGYEDTDLAHLRVLDLQPHIGHECGIQFRILTGGKAKFCPGCGKALPGSPEEAKRQRLKELGGES